MRLTLSRLLAGLTAGQMLIAPLAQAACATPAEKPAFDVAGLKSELMVVALTCNERDKYNNFVVRYQPALMSQDRALNSYFRRAFGRAAQKQHDDYITQLANTQSETGIQQGTLFCMHNAKLFDEVLALPQGADLAGYAAAKAFVQPAEFTTCTQAAPHAKTVRTRTASASPSARNVSSTTRH
jgi:hypothetical protein